MMAAVSVMQLLYMSKQFNSNSQPTMRMNMLAWRFVCPWGSRSSRIHLNIQPSAAFHNNTIKTSSATPSVDFSNSGVTLNHMYSSLVITQRVYTVDAWLCTVPGEGERCSTIVDQIIWCTYDILSYSYGEGERGRDNR